MSCWKSWLAVGCALLLSSCNNVQFATPQSKLASTSPDGGVPPLGNEDTTVGHTGIIQCSPTVNGGAGPATVTTANPSVAANCSPASNNYAWSVTSGGSSITVPGLSGAQSVPDFLSVGAGLYFIGFSATQTGWGTYQLPAPMQVTVQPTNSGLPTIHCDPKINGSLTDITLAGANPSLSANCVPGNVGYVWTPVRAGVPVVVPGLSGSAPTPDFLSMAAGTYEVLLTATQTGYNPYIPSSGLSIVVPGPGGGGPGGGGGGTPVVESHTVTSSNNKLDIVLVIDDSNSMLADNQHLAGKLESFVSSLTSLGYDWQMCVTLTRAQRISNTDPKYYWGASVNWAGNGSTPAWILKPGQTNTYSIFRDTVDQIGAGWLGTDDERAIKALWWHLWNGEPGVTGSSGCYRQDAGLAVLILSDEDERSIGGDETQAYYEHELGRPLENDDLPATYVDYVRQVFGNTKRFSVNSIIVRPGDQACLSQQDGGGSKAHFGVHYAELSALTSGYVGSICDADYSANLNYFQQHIVTSLASVPLQCAPLGNVQAALTPTMSFTSQVDNGRLVFSPQVPAGTKIDLSYTCP